jgi:hypothetical protein
MMEAASAPSRRIFNAIVVAGTCGAYLNGGFGRWEFIGLAWIMHAAWDLAHHLWGNPIWPFMPTSSWGCMIFDSLIALWFLAGAPSLWSTKLLNRVKA